MKITLQTGVKDLEKGVVRVSFNDSGKTEWLKDAKGVHSLSVGLGSSRETMTLRKVRVALRKMAGVLKGSELKRSVIDRKEFKFPKARLSEFELGRLIAVETHLANFEFVKYKTAPKNGFNFIEELGIVGTVTNEFKKGVAMGEIIAGEVNATRELANTPGGDMTPELLATAAIQAAKGTSVKVKVLGKSEIEKLGMGGVLGVSRGSSEEPKFIIAEYWGAGPASAKSSSVARRPIVLVGKGVTFDTGGLNIKPSDGIYEMHMDMSGGAAVIHAVVLAAKLGIKKNVIALVPAVENMPSGSSYRPGDILKTISGKTIEVLNTDAEGRIILADGLGYAKRYNPRLVVDVATLTGAAMVALGQRANAIFTTDARLEKLTRDIGEKTGDYSWPMPLWEDYEQEVRGTFGDWANLGSKARMGGAITAAVFLWQFAKDYAKDCPWMHIDMAPRMTAVEGEALSKGATGTPVQLLVELVKNY